MQKIVAHFQKRERSLRFLRIYAVNHGIRAGLWSLNNFPRSPRYHFGAFLRLVRVVADRNVILSDEVVSCRQTGVLIGQQLDLPLDVMTLRVRRKPAEKFPWQSITRRAANEFSGDRVLRVGRTAHREARS